MSHKKVSQLVELTSAEVQLDDLFYVIDSSAREGKKISAQSLAEYLANSGSLYAIHAINSDTASYVLGTNIHGSVTSSISASYAVNSSTASYSFNTTSASYSSTASYVINGIFSNISSSWASSSISASYALKSTSASYADNSKFLSFNGTNNGTASYAMKTSNVDSVTSASYAKTSSYLATGISNIDSASWSDRSGNSNYAQDSGTSNFLNYDFGINNGTASYAISAGGFSFNSMFDYGILVATTQSISSSQLDNFNIFSLIDSNLYETSVESCGTIIVPFTSSIPLDETISLIIKSRDTGIETILDTSPIYVNISRTLGDWDSLMTGSIKMPYNLIGSSSLNGEYMTFVTGSSSKIQIDSNRISRFMISSKAQGFSSNIDEPLIFNITTLDSLFTASFNFTTNAGGPFINDRLKMLSSGSSNILTLNANSQSLISIRYVWSLNNLTSLICSNNPITYLGGMPNTLQTLQCYSCSLNEISSLSNTSLISFDCSNNYLDSIPTIPQTLNNLFCNNNNITSIPILPNTMSQLICSYNNIISTPAQFPFGLQKLYLDNNQLTTFTTTLPNSIVSMSLSYNNNLYILGSFIPTSMSYFQAISCSLGQTEMDKVFSQSFSNGLLNGYIYLNGNGNVSFSTETNYILPLQSSGWTIGYDGVG